MRFFLPRRRHGSDFEDAPGQRVLRTVLLVCILAAVCWGFWKNSQRRMEALAVHGVLQDETKELGAQDKEFLLARAAALRSGHGLNLKVRVYLTPSGLREASPREVYLDIFPARREELFTLPPLVRRAVGDDFIRALEDSFEPYFASGAWPKALPPALDALVGKLNEVSR